MPSVPASFIEQVRNATELTEVISQYVPLKRAGKNFVGLCPFHKEKTPSFNVSPDRQIFHCFGCGQGGDAFKFLMQYEKMSFIEAVEHLASRAGLTVPVRGQDARKYRDERSLLFELYDEAARFFHRRLHEKADGHEALSYLRERGVSQRTIEERGLGYAPPSWSALLEHFTRKGRKPEELARSGLVAPRREGHGFYDRFRGRVMVPIRNESGKIVAFGGRLLGRGEPKYLNSPESPIYVKSRILFDFDRAKEAIRRSGTAVLMEGYLDSIQAHQAGISNAAATCGTSLTAGHAQLLRRSGDHVVVNFDPDDAGEAATRRGIDLLIEEGFQVSVLSLPSGEDPDTFIRNRGPEAYRERLDEADSFVDYLINRGVCQHDVRTPRGKAAFLNSVLPTLARIPNHVERVAYVSRLAERAEVFDAAIVAELRRAVMERRGEVKTPSERASPLTPAERDLVRWMLHSPPEAERLLADVDEEDLQELTTAPILRAMQKVASSATLSTERVLEHLSTEGEKNLLTRIALDPSPLGPRQSPRDCLNRLREQRWRRKLSHLRAKLAESAEDDSIAHEIQALARRIETLGRIGNLA